MADVNLEIDMQNCISYILQVFFVVLTYLKMGKAFYIAKLSIAKLSNVKVTLLL